MSISDSSLLDSYARIAEETYRDDVISVDPLLAANGTYVEITQVIDGPSGFQARAFFNSTTDDLVIAFAGTEGSDDGDVAELLPDLVTDLALLVAGASPQDVAAQRLTASSPAQNRRTSLMNSSWTLLMAM